MENTNEQMLIEVETAIQKILVTGQTYKIGSRQLTRADISELIKWRDNLQAQVSEENGTGLMGNTYVAVFEGR